MAATIRPARPVSEPTETVEAPLGAEVSAAPEPVGEAEPDCEPVGEEPDSEAPEAEPDAEEDLTNETSVFGPACGCRESNTRWTHDPPPFRQPELDDSWMEMGSEYWGCPLESMTRMVL